MPTPSPAPVVVPKVDEALYQRSHFATTGDFTSRDGCVYRRMAEAAKTPMSLSEMRRTAHEVTATCSALLWPSMRRYANDAGEQVREATVEAQDRLATERLALGVMSPVQPAAVESPTKPKSLTPTSNHPTQQATVLPPTGGPATSNTTEVGLVKEGGTFKIPVIINGIIPLHFTVDSGAADVSIPADVVSTLVRTGTITKSDFIGLRTYVLADGSEVPSTTFRIRSLKVGDRTIENVVGSIAGWKGSLLLGQSFLSRFRRVSFDYSRQVLVLE